MSLARTISERMVASMVKAWRRSVSIPHTVIATLGFLPPRLASRRIATTLQRYDDLIQKAVPALPLRVWRELVFACRNADFHRHHVPLLSCVRALPHDSPEVLDIVEGLDPFAHMAVVEVLTRIQCRKPLGESLDVALRSCGVTLAD